VFFFFRLTGDVCDVWFFFLFFCFRSLEKPIVHRYKEIEEFPHALNNSQMWNWSARLFITEARDNLTIDEQQKQPQQQQQQKSLDDDDDNDHDATPSLVSRYTKTEIDNLEKTLKEHEAWLAEWVAKQKTVAMYEDPVILTSEMKARAKTLENHLQRLVKKKPAPKNKKNKKKNGSNKSSAGAGAGTSSTTTTTAADRSGSASSSLDDDLETGVPVSKPAAGGDDDGADSKHGHDEL
jgi:hypoxia up-regulated 1